jgi:hypothetical protein
MSFRRYVFLAGHAAADQFPPGAIGPPLSSARCPPPRKTGGHMILFSVIRDQDVALTATLLAIRQS